jgi:hypothetical protein
MGSKCTVTPAAHHQHTKLINTEVINTDFLAENQLHAQKPAAQLQHVTVKLDTKAQIQ